MKESERSRRNGRVKDEEERGETRAARRTIKGSSIPSMRVLRREGGRGRKKSRVCGVSEIKETLPLFFFLCRRRGVCAENFERARDFHPFPARGSKTSPFSIGQLSHIRTARPT